MKKIGFCFGGSSVEHEVSVISGIQAALATDSSKYDVVPIYISKDKDWFTGAPLLDIKNYQKDIASLPNVSKVHASPTKRNSLLLSSSKKSWFSKGQGVEVDALFLVFHGSSGENGAFQGMCEQWGIPYTGSGIAGSAVAMDKDLSKIVSKGAGIPVVNYVAVRDEEWTGKEEIILNDFEEKLSYPLVVKPSRLGSSIGISMATKRTELDKAIEEAFRYDSKIVVERGISSLKEINCSVLGLPHDARASVLEQPVNSSEDLLTFEDKYQGGGGKSDGGSKQGSSGMASLDRLIPAPISDEQSKIIQNMALKIFEVFECSGVCRIDFMIDMETDEVYFNEINTIPGSLSFYLWEASGLSFKDLNTKLIEIAFERDKSRRSKITNYNTNLLQENSLKGLKGAKS